MPGPAVRRRLATVLFLDIVGSTALATQLGDARWKELLTRFRRLVRSELKRYGGREQDTSGDGFLATFAEPVQALRAAASIAHAVQELGVDVRAGAHTGECERIDGKVGGIAVHIGSRAMALAGPAEVVVTGTVRDLVAGSGASFDDHGTHELKGVDGSWRVYNLRAVETPLPVPLPPEVAAERLALVTPSACSRRRRMMIAAGGVATALAIVVPLLAVGGGAAKASPISLLRLDPRTGGVEAVSHDGPLGCPCAANLWAVNGTLWQRFGDSGGALAVRKLRTGKLERTLTLPAGTVAFAFGEGSVWVLRSTVVLSGPTAGTPINRVDRVDELSGRTLARIPIPGNTDSGSIATGNGAIWVLQGDATLDRIDPSTNRVTAMYHTGALETSILIPLDGYAWICECERYSILRFDPRTGRSTRFHFAEQPFRLVPVDSAHGRTLWLLDTPGATLTRIDPRSGHARQPLGLSGQPTQAVVAAESIWVAAGKVVDRVSLSTGQRTTIAMPRGFSVGGIAADAATGAIWVDNSAKPPTG
jgi:class 3 adenylate cyclase/streptogramin lyase